MSNLPSTKRFYAEDYKEAPQWFQRFTGQLNLFTEPTYNIMNGGLSTENTIEEIYSLQVKNASATGSSNTFLFSPKKFVGAPNGVIIGQCLFNSTTGIATAIGNPVTLDWVYTGSQIKILAVYGLTASANYTLTLKIF